eukprot:scaffold201952_cov17-Tisochrysis_lutea.AAC.1
MRLANYSPNDHVGVPDKGDPLYLVPSYFTPSGFKIHFAPGSQLVHFLRFQDPLCTWFPAGSPPQ